MGLTYPHSEIIPIYYLAGTFPNDQKKKYLRAPVDIVKINGAIYFQPRSCAISTDSLSQFSNSDGDVSLVAGNGLSFTCLDETVIMGEHEWGDMSDSWKGVNRFTWM